MNFKNQFYIYKIKYKMDYIENRRKTTKKND